MRRSGVVVGVVLAALAVAVRSGAYEVVPVTDGGTLRGTITIYGEAPPPQSIAITKDKAVCGEQKTRSDLVVGPEGGIANVAVVVKATKGRALEVPAQPVTFDQRGCEYSPRVLAFPAGSTLAVLNPDGILHNVHVMGKTNPEANRAMPKFQKKIDWIVEKAEWPIQVKCDAHPWMRAYWLAMDHPYYAVTGPDGAFTIADLPPGDYDVELWHETLGRRTERVTIPPKSEATVAWAFAAPTTTTTTPPTTSTTASPGGAVTTTTTPEVLE
jgi:plastocyanin